MPLRLLDRPARTVLVAALFLSLVAASLVFVAPRAAADTPVSGSFALGDGLAGEIDARTGQLAVSLPLVRVDGRGDADVDVTLSWQQERAVQGLDRSGWGAGWSIGSTFVQVSGRKTVYPAAGGAYAVDAAAPSGLANYLLQDLQFATRAGTLPARPGAAAVGYAYVLSYGDGRTDYYDADGNLVVRTDRFGNRSDLTWQARPGGRWRPVAIVDAYGLSTTFDYTTPDVVRVSSPKRSDGIVATSSVELGADQAVASVTDPVGQRSVFFYAPVPGAPKPLLNSMTGPSGARSRIGYQTLTYANPALTSVVVQSVRVVDGTGRDLTPARIFNPDPTGSRHNYLGYPTHVGNGDNTLFASGDRGYTYTTSLASGRTAMVSTYDALHRLIGKVVQTTNPGPNQSSVVLQRQVIGYPAPVGPPSGLPPNYGRASSTRVTFSARTSTAGAQTTAGRTTTSTATYDTRGRVTSATDNAETTTVTTYDDRFGEVLTRTTTGPDGNQAREVNVLTADGRSVQTTTRLESPAAGRPPTARRSTTYAYDEFGQLASQTLSWAPGAAPPANGGGPAEVVATVSQRTVNLAGGVEVIALTKADKTSAASIATSTIDLVTGQVVAAADPLGRVTTYAYDAVGRRTKQTTPGNRVTTTTYGNPAADGTSATTVTAPDGHVARTTQDQLGRPILVTDNVRSGAFVTDVGARTVSARSYSADGTTLTVTDQLGRTTSTILDALGRPVSKTGPTGLTHLASYDDGAAHSEVRSVRGEGANRAAVTTTSRFDDANRKLGSRTTYPAPGTRPGVFTADPLQAATYDGIGRATSTAEADLAVALDWSQPAGEPQTSTATPTNTDDFPGEPVTAVTTRSLTGATSSRTLTQNGQTSEAAVVTYDAAGNLTSSTDPGGRRTTFAYYPDGRIKSRTGPAESGDPTGTITRYGYDAETGDLETVEVDPPSQPAQLTTYTRIPNGQPGAGQVRSVTRSAGSPGAGTMTYGYDADGHVTSVAYPDGTATAATYFDTGQPATTTDVTGAVTTYVHNPDGSTKSATQTRAGVTLASVSYSYDFLTRIDTITRGNGTVTKHTYTNTNLLATQTTTNAAGTVVEAHSYTYDSHHNPATRTDTYPAGGSATAPGSATWTTAYDYDAYDRLAGSAVYAGPLGADGRPTGSPTTSTTYELDVAGNVTSSEQTLTTPGPTPSTTTTTTVNTIDDADRLTNRTVTGQPAATQTFDAEGRVRTALNGSVHTYFADGSPRGITTADGTRVGYTLWPDGTRRAATTTTPGGATSTVTLHYGTDQTLVNDSTSDAATAPGTSATASYLTTVNREARTLLTGTAANGSVSGAPSAATTTGAGVGYYLRDRHTSVTSQLDAAAQVSGTWAYGDYGTAARADGRATAPSTSAGGRTNPFTYTGSTAQAVWTEPATGLLVMPSRTYDPSQGRFTSPDPIDAHNLYQAFKANPIVYLDVTGEFPWFDFVLEITFTVLMAAATIATAGAAIGGLMAVSAVDVGLVTAGAVVNIVANTVAAAANLVSFTANALLMFDDIDRLGKHSKTGFLGAKGRRVLSYVNNVAGAVGGVASFSAVLTDGAAAAAGDLAKAAAKVKAPVNTAINAVENEGNLLIKTASSTSSTVSGDIIEINDGVTQLTDGPPRANNVGSTGSEIEIDDESAVRAADKVKPPTTTGTSVEDATPEVSEKPDPTAAKVIGKDKVLSTAITAGQEVTNLTRDVSEKANSPEAELPPIATPPRGPGAKPLPVNAGSFISDNVADADREVDQSSSRVN